MPPTLEIIKYRITGGMLSRRQAGEHVEHNHNMATRLRRDAMPPKTRAPGDEAWVIHVLENHLTTQQP